MGKLRELHGLQEEIESCSVCKNAGTGKQVFGEGNPDAQIMFVGEAPGKKEAESGKPFIGRSGQLLHATIRSIGLNESDVYITSPVKFLPKRGTPTKKETDHSNIHFQKQVEIIKPKIMVLLGKTAIHAILEKNILILKEHGKHIRKDGRSIFITLHPAAVLRFSKYKKIFEEDFMKIKKLMG